MKFSAALFVLCGVYVAVATQLQVPMCPVKSGSTFGACVESCSDDSQCPEEQKCCFNGCGHTCMDPSPVPYHSPPLMCPQIRRDVAGACVDECADDSVCEDGYLCCSNGCGHVCTEGVSPSPLCVATREQVTSQSLIGAYVPQCEEDGTFSAVQCHGSTGYCWCVDTETGLPETGLYERGERPQCSDSSKDCPEGMEYKECGTACPATCSDPNPACIRVCKTGCFCPNDKLLNKETGACVSASDCPDSSKDCPEGMEYKECGTACPATCSDPSPACIRVCKTGCFCRDDKLLNKETGECVSASDCPDSSKDCPEGMEYKECGTACPATCSDPSPACIQVCKTGCFCRDDMLLNKETGECVSASDCPDSSKDCPEGMEYKECGTACPATCSDPNPACIQVCKTGCFCPNDKLLNKETGACVSASDCPGDSNPRTSSDHEEL